MKQFHFHLHPLLDHRKRKEQIIQKELAMCEKKLIDERSVLLGIENNLTEIYERVYTEQDEFSMISSHVIRNNFIDKLKNDILICAGKISEIEKEITLKRSELMEAVKDRKVVDNLKSKKLSEYEEEQKREEQKITDEAGIHMYNRRKMDSYNIINNMLFD